MKKYLFLLTFIFVSTLLSAQTADPFPTWSKDLAKYVVAIAVWLFNNWDEVFGLFAALLVALQTVLRIIPTKHNYDFLSLWIEWLNEHIPNKAKGGGVFRTSTTKELDK